MFKLFKKKEVKCHTCSRILEKDKFHVLDSTCRGEYKDKEKMKLCTPCFIEKFREFLTEYEGFAIVIEPFKPYNAYQFYSFAEMVEYNWPIKKVDKIKELIPQIKDCESCSSKASFLLFPPEFYSRDPHKININPDISGKILCARCLSGELRKAIDREQLFFWEVLPPLKENGYGFLTPFEV